MLPLIDWATTSWLHYLCLRPQVMSGSFCVVLLSVSVFHPRMLMDFSSYNKNSICWLIEPLFQTQMEDQQHSHNVPANGCPKLPFQTNLWVNTGKTLRNKGKKFRVSYLNHPFRFRLRPFFIPKTNCSRQKSSKGL